MSFPVKPFQGSTRKQQNLETKPLGSFTYQYDILGRIMSLASAMGTKLYQYVPTDNRLEMLDKIVGPNSTTEYKYGSFNRVTENKETLTGGKD